MCVLTVHVVCTHRNNPNKFLSLPRTLPSPHASLAQLFYRSPREPFEQVHWQGQLPTMPNRYHIQSLSEPLPLCKRVPLDPPATNPAFPPFDPLSQTGTFTDKPIPSVNECQTCHPTCKSCTGALASECASCHGSAVLKEGACSCPAGKSGTFPTRHAGTRTLLHFSPHPNLSTSFHFLSLSHAGYYGDPQDKSAGNDNCFQCPAGQNTPVLCVSLHSHSMTHSQAHCTRKHTRKLYCNTRCAGRAHR